MKSKPLKPFRRAVIVREFTTATLGASWPVGRRIKVRPMGQRRYFIERARWQGKLAIINQVANVPRAAFAFLS